MLRVELQQAEHWPDVCREELKAQLSEAAAVKAQFTADTEAVQIKMQSTEAMINSTADRRRAAAQTSPHKMASSKAGHCEQLEQLEAPDRTSDAAKDVGGCGSRESGNIYSDLAKLKQKVASNRAELAAIQARRAPLEEEGLLVTLKAKLQEAEEELAQMPVRAQTEQEVRKTHIGDR